MEECNMTAEQLAESYDTYTDPDEIGREVTTEEREAALPTTTVLTTSLHCFE
jgi:hypothetical protein